jgi:hypothetical protein
LEQPFKSLQINAAVAMLDILGFGLKAVNLGIAEARKQIIEPLLFCFCDASRIVFKNSNSTKIRNPIRGWTFYADTIILYIESNESTTHPTPRNSIDQMAHICSLSSAMCLWFNLPLRGAIAFGEIAICENPVYILGKPFIEAHNLERRQNWAGISLCKSASDHFNEEHPKYIVNYKVPFKNSDRDKPCIYSCINWPGQCVLAEEAKDIRGNSNMPNWEDCFNSDDPEVQEKKKNTITFFNAFNRQNAGHNVSSASTKTVFDLSPKWVLEEMYKWQPRLKDYNESR